ncbi:MAG: molybdate ABC transporter substrate-binding protein [Acidimicrobiales bacterium]
MRRTVLVGLALLAACGDAAAPAITAPAITAGATTAPVTTAVSGTIRVFAASSLTGAFTALGEAFRTANPGATVTFSFAASSALVAQLGEGAPGDVFASADEATMAKLVDAKGAAGTPVVFATNRLQIAVGPGNPTGVTALADLARPGLAVVLCAPQVPCGRYAAEALSTAGVAVTPKSLEENVRAVLTKVQLGEADAGIVYETDVRATDGKVTGVAIPADRNVVARYPIVVTAGARAPDAARAFVAFTTSSAGQAVLARFGFGAP